MKEISALELTDLILTIFRQGDNVRGVKLANRTLSELKKRGFTHVTYSGRSREITEELIKKKTFKVMSRHNDGAYKIQEKTAEPPPAPVSWEQDIEKKAESYNKKSLTEKYDEALEVIQRLRRLLDLNGVLSAPMQDFKIPVKGKQKDQSVAVALASDWHYEEKVDPAAVNGLNAFNLQIADARIKNFFGNTVKLLHKEQQDTTIRKLILGLLGDFITGDIHEDNVESAQVGIMKALWAVMSRIHSGIQFILDNTDVDLIIDCHSGNHGRHTKKQRIANENENSLEWFMYKCLQKNWSDHPRVTFMVGDAYHSYIEVFPGFIMRNSHGHFVKYGGGVGGITIPINKAIAQWNRNRTANLDNMGHFHQLFDGGNFVVNSSLIGFSPYAISIKGAYEKPTQSFYLINGKYLEKTCFSKIFLDDKING